MTFESDLATAIENRKTKEVQRLLKANMDKKDKFKEKKLNTIDFPLSIAASDVFVGMDYEKFTEVPEDLLKIENGAILDDVEFDTNWWHQMYVSLLPRLSNPYNFMRHAGASVIYFMNALPEDIRPYYGCYILCEETKQVWFINLKLETVAIALHDRPDFSYEGMSEAMAHYPRDPDHPFLAINYEDNEVIFEKNGYKRDVKIRKNPVTLKNIKVIDACIRQAVYQDRLNDAQRFMLQEKLIEGANNCSRGFDARLASTTQLISIPSNFSELLYNLRKFLVEHVYTKNTNGDIYVITKISVMASLGFGVPSINTCEPQFDEGYSRKIISRLLTEFKNIARLYPLANQLQLTLQQLFAGYGYNGPRYITPADLVIVESRDQIELDKYQSCYVYIRQYSMVGAMLYVHPTEINDADTKKTIPSYEAIKSDGSGLPESTVVLESLSESDLTKYQGQSIYVKQFSPIGGLLYIHPKSHKELERELNVEVRELDEPESFEKVLSELQGKAGSKQPESTTAPNNDAKPINRLHLNESQVVSLIEKEGGLQKTNDTYTRKEQDQYKELINNTLSTQLGTYDLFIISGSNAGNDTDVRAEDTSPMQ